MLNPFQALWLRPRLIAAIVLGAIVVLLMPGDSLVTRALTGWCVGVIAYIILVVQLERWDPNRHYERLGLDDQHFEILGLRVPLIRMPVAPGRNIAILVEVAARNQLLRSRGHHPARLLADRLEQQLRRSAVRLNDDGDDDDELDSGDSE